MSDFCSTRRTEVDCVVTDYRACYSTSTTDEPPVLRAHELIWARCAARSSYSPEEFANIATFRAIANHAAVDARTSVNAASRSDWLIMRASPARIESAS